LLLSKHEQILVGKIKDIYFLFYHTYMKDCSVCCCAWNQTGFCKPWNVFICMLIWQRRLWTHLIHTSMSWRWLSIN